MSGLGRSAVRPDDRLDTTRLTGTRQGPWPAISARYAGDKRLRGILLGMPFRQTRIAQATSRAKHNLDATIRDLVIARQMADLAQAAVARAIGVSRSTIAAWEQRRNDPPLTELYRWAAVVGLDASLRTFPGDDPLRDIGQVRLLDRFATLIGPDWDWWSEVPVSPDPRDRRAFDAVIRRDGRRAAVEAIVHLMDAQGQVRPIIAKQSVSGIACVMLVLADTRHNRLAVAAGAATIGPAFPIGPRPGLASLRRGEVPAANVIVYA